MSDRFQNSDALNESRILGGLASGYSVSVQYVFSGIVVRQAGPILFPNTLNHRAWILNHRFGLFVRRAPNHLWSGQTQTPISAEVRDDRRPRLRGALRHPAMALDI